MSVDIRLPFGEYMLACIRDTRKENPQGISDKMWHEAFERAHEAWHRARERRKPAKVVSSEAEAIFALYPKKVGKQAALRAIVRVLEKVPSDILAERVRTYAGFVERWRKDDRAFVPHPSTWFNEGRYDDDPKEWERPSMAPLPRAQSAPTGPIPEPPDFAMRLKAMGSDDEYAAGGTCNRDGKCLWADMDPFYQRRIVRLLGVPA